LLYQQQGNYVAGAQRCQEALRSAREIGDRPVQGRALTYLGHAYMALGRLEEAADVYQQAAMLRTDLGELHLSMDPLVGLAAATYRAGQTEAARHHLEMALHFIENNALDGADDPLRIYMTCYELLQANQDQRGRDILEQAYAMLQERAARISDPNLQHAFLEYVPYHRRLVREWLREAHVDQPSNVGQ
jgi:tetratricopeptide (TPR) repeat protein